MRGAASSVGNFGPGMRFHYLPDRTINAPTNVDSAEYANIVLTFTRFYDQARRAGMPRAERRPPSELMRQWITRAISGYWTHAGYMNWDSGLGFERWHQGKKLGLTQEALIGLASSDTLLPGKQWGQWSKSMLDNGFDFYDRLAARAQDGLAGPGPVRPHRGPAGRRAAPTSPPRASRPTPPARSTPASASKAGRRRRRRCTPTTPTSAASP